jgi:hypothetical protein
MQAIKRVPTVPEILQPPRPRELWWLNANATPVTWTHPHIPYAPRQTPVKNQGFALLSTEERECASCVRMFQRMACLGLDVVQLSLGNKISCKRALQHAVEQNQDQVATPANPGKPVHTDRSVKNARLESTIPCLDPPRASTALQIRTPA